MEAKDFIMEGKGKLNKIGLLAIGIMVSICMAFMLENSCVVYAKGRLGLSLTEKKVTEGEKVTVSLNGMYSKAGMDRLKWKIGNPDVLKICDRNGNRVTVKALENGISTLRVSYKGKNYECRILVKGRYDDNWDGLENQNKADAERKEDKNGSEAKIVKNRPALNATEINLHYISDYAVPYIGKSPDHRYSFRFKVYTAGRSNVKWSIEGDGTAKLRYSISDNGTVHMNFGNGIGDEYTECTVVATLSNGTRLTAKVRGYDDDNAYILDRIEEFQKKYISEGMTEYEKVDRVAWYLSSDFDYELYQDDWCRYIITGSGDCMASRIAVEHFCKAIGIRAIACRDLDAHGQTLVKADGRGYLVRTGFGGRKPRYYEIDELTDKEFDGLCEKNNINPEYFNEVH